MARRTGWQGWRLVRSGGAAPQPEIVAQRSRPFGAAVGQVGAAALVAVRDERGVSGFVALPPAARGRTAEVAVSSLAAAVAAKPESVEALPDLSAARCVGWLVARPSPFVIRDTQAGGDPAEVALALARVMVPGSWVAVSMRRAHRREWSTARRWFDHRLEGIATHYSREGEALLCSIFAGGASRFEVEGVLSQLAAVLPGFDIDVGVVVAGVTGAAVGLIGAGAAGLFGAGIGLHHWSYGAAAAGTAALGTGALTTGTIPTRSTRVRRALRAGRLPSPARRLTRARPPQREHTRTFPDGQVRTQPEQPGSWPLAPSTFLMAPGMVVGVIAPHAGMASDVAVTRMRRVPAALTGDIGPLVGYAGEEDEPVHLDARALEEGVGLLGIRGSGKTQLCQALFAWASAERVAPSGKPERPGRANTLVAFESKGEVGGWQDWISTLGDRSMLVEVGEPSSSAIDLFAVPGRAAERARFFVNSMVYAFGPNDIQGRSYETLTAVFAAALTIPPGVARGAGLEPDSSPVQLAHALLGGLGDDIAVRLAGALAEAVAKAPDSPKRAEAAAACRALAPIFEAKVTPAQRRNLCEAARNKVAVLTEAGSWWSPQRPHVSWDQVITEHRVVVINTGVTSAGRLVDDRLGAVMSAMLTYGLRGAIARSCSGWAASGRSVSIFADELALLAGSSAEVVTWLQNQGRSYGVRCVFAAQYPEQLDVKVRDCLLGFSTLFWFRQNHPNVVASAVAQLSMLGGEWSASDMAGLEPYHAILLALADGRTQPAVPIRVAWWGDDPGGFAADQGYRIEPPAASIPDAHPAGLASAVGSPSDSAAGHDETHAARRPDPYDSDTYSPSSLTSRTS